MATNGGNRVVLEYRFKGYSPPDHLSEDFGVACCVTSVAGARIRSTGDLSAMRAELEERGFEQHGATQVQGQTHRIDRYDPRWREVWVREVAEASASQPMRSLGGNLYGLSPEAQKAVEQARARDRSYQPWLARTGDRAIVCRPRLIGRKASRLFAQSMAASLPQFTFNPRKDRWEAPLDQLPAAYEAFKPRVSLSDGAEEYLKEVGGDG